MGLGLSAWYDAAPLSPEAVVPLSGSTPPATRIATCQPSSCPRRPGQSPTRRRSIPEAIDDFSVRHGSATAGLCLKRPSGAFYRNRAQGARQQVAERPSDRADRPHAGSRGRPAGRRPTWPPRGPGPVGLPARRDRGGRAGGPGQGEGRRRADRRPAGAGKGARMPTPFFGQGRSATAETTVDWRTALRGD
jgi:hypothetical protein